MRVLITGSSGFVGKAIVSEFSDKGIELVLIDRRAAEGTNSAARFFAGDITDPDQLRGLNIGPVNAVIHAAGLAHQFGPVTKEKFWQINVEGTRNAARLAAELKAKRFILISSVSVYGRRRGDVGPVTEKRECRPEGLYAESKYNSERVAREVCAKSEIELVVLRLATVIGEGDAGNTARLVRAIDKRRFLWIGRGENSKSLIYKGDVARACRILIESRAAKGGIYNVTARPERMRSIVSFIEKALGKNTFPVNIPARLLRLGFEANSGTLNIGKISRLQGTVEKWLSDEIFSGDKLKADYGFEPKTTVADALTREVDWYLKNK